MYLKEPSSPPMKEKLRQHSHSYRYRTVEAFVKAEVAHRTAQCRFLMKNDNSYISSSSPRKEDQIAIFRRDEIHTSNLIGMGAYSEVHEISGFQLSNFLLMDPIREDPREHIQATAATVQHNGQSKYVLKHLRRDQSTGSRSRFIKSSVDLIMEAKFLSKFDHPNIIKLRGWAGESAATSLTDCCSSSNGLFLILDRLDETLSKRIKVWKMEEELFQQHYVGGGSIAQNSTTYKEKLTIALQIANALDYLHDHDIIFRDLKPDNIGFKGQTVQIFDFGLVKQLPEEQPNDDKLFQMSGIGTRRYMAPEVVNGIGYNLKADVYSWTMVLYSMIALQKPFQGYSVPLHKLLVCEQGIRPTLFPIWPEEIQELCQRGWAHSYKDRPTIKEICKSIVPILQSYNSINNIMRKNNRPHSLKQKYEMSKCKIRVT